MTYLEVLDKFSSARDRAAFAGEERRILPRFPLQIPLLLHTTGNGGACAITRNISAGGVFFFLNCVLKEHSTIEFTLTLPRELTRAIDLHVSCRATILRLEEGGATHPSGVAAAIHSFDFVEDDVSP